MFTGELRFIYFFLVFFLSFTTTQKCHPSIRLPLDSKYRVKYACTHCHSVEVNGENLVLRTSNKKYFKRFVVPDLQRLGLAPDATRITLAHANNTLLITVR